MQVSMHSAGFIMNHSMGASSTPVLRVCQRKKRAPPIGWWIGQQGCNEAGLTQLGHLHRLNTQAEVGTSDGGCDRPQRISKCDHLHHLAFQAFSRPVTRPSITFGFGFTPVVFSLGHVQHCIGPASPPMNYDICRPEMNCLARLQSCCFPNFLFRRRQAMGQAENTILKQVFALLLG